MLQLFILYVQQLDCVLRQLSHLYVEAKFSHSRNFGVGMRVIMYYRFYVLVNVIQFWSFCIWRIIVFFWLYPMLCDIVSVFCFLVFHSQEQEIFIWWCSIAISFVLQNITVILHHVDSLNIFDAQIDENVQREIINHRSLRHPNIVRFKEVCTEHILVVSWKFCL